MKESLTCVDLFCGAGGTSSGLLSAAEALSLDVELLAINHWQLAVATHKSNLPRARHLCEPLEGVDPISVVPTGRVHLLVASPECRHFSSARGGRAMNDQSRSSAWNVLRWCEQLHVENLLIENVTEFMSWGPLHPDDHSDQMLRGRPVHEEKGKFFANFLNNLRCLGYAVDYRVLNAANYGDATSRERLFIQARLGDRHSITWPEPTHHSRPDDPLGMFHDAPTWRKACEIIDWAIPCASIFNRKKPLSANTMRRIKIGMEKFNGKPFLIRFNGNGDCARLDAPLPTVTTRDRFALVTPELVAAADGPTMRDIRLRMLSPRELARAHSFPENYKFSGSRNDEVRQIGNSVPVQLARAITLELIKQYA